MASFQQILNGFNIASEAIKASLPAVTEWNSGDHAGAVSQMIEVAGATAVAAAGSDATVAAEASAATNLALTFAPLILGIVSLFHKNKTAPTTTTSTDVGQAAPAASAAA